MKSKKCSVIGCINPWTTLWSPDVGVKHEYFCDKHLYEMKELKKSIDECNSMFEDIKQKFPGLIKEKE
jgi:hypothetical protein